MVSMKTVTAMMAEGVDMKIVIQYGCFIALGVLFNTFSHEARADARSDAAEFCSMYNYEKGVNMCGSQRCPCGRATTEVARFDAPRLQKSRCSCVNKKKLAAWEATQNQPQCNIDNECDDGIWCNGAETCSAGHCQPGVPPCDAGTQCFAETRSCSTVCEDKDGDGFPAIHCGGNDCDDNNANRYPGNVEICDARGIDEDCDTSTVGDLDEDGDGFVSPNCK
jgi:hypothetical protein